MKIKIKPLNIDKYNENEEKHNVVYSAVKSTSNLDQIQTIGGFLHEHTDVMKRGVQGNKLEILLYTG